MKTKLALISLGLLAISGNVLASDEHSYNGQGCDNYFAADTGNFNHDAYGVRNNSTSNLYISCPVVVDAVDNTSGTNTTYIRWDGTGVISCSLASRDANGNLIQGQHGSKNGGGWFSIPGLTKDDKFGNYSLLSASNKVSY